MPHKPWEKTGGPKYRGPTPQDRARKSATSKKKPQGESLVSRKLKSDLSIVLPGSVWWKNAGSEFGESGLPDIMGIVNGRIVCIEVKYNGGQFSRLQVAWLRKAERAGAVAVGMMFEKMQPGVCWIIPTNSMGTKGNRKRELWVKVEYPAGLKNIIHWNSRVI